MSIAFSGCKTQILRPHFRPDLPHFYVSPTLLPYPKRPISFTTSSSLVHHNRHRVSPLEFLTGRCPARLGSSLLTQDPILDEEEEEETDGRGIRGSDWGQLDEVSDDDEEKENLTGFGFGERGRRGGFSVPPEGARLFVGNLPFDVGSEELAGIFQQAGEIEVAEVIYSRETDRSRGFGFVTMRTVEEAEKAIDMFNNYDLNGRLLAVNKASRRGSQPIRAAGGFGSNRRIFVGNLPWQVDSARLEQVFGEHGKVLEARVVYETDTGRSRGFGFVKMSTDKEIDNAITNLDGKNLEGRPIRVNVAEERPRRSF